MIISFLLLTELIPISERHKSNFTKKQIRKLINSSMIILSLVQAPKQFQNMSPRSVNKYVAILRRIIKIITHVVIVA